MIAIVVGKGKGGEGGYLPNETLKIAMRDKILLENMYIVVEHVTRLPDINVTFFFAGR